MHSQESQVIIPAAYKLQMSGIKCTPECLSEDNLLPIYLIEDKLQTNFRKVNSFMTEAGSNFQHIQASIAALHHSQDALKADFQARMVEIERKIVNDISMEIDGRITIAMSKNLQSMADRLRAEDKGTAELEERVDKKMAKLKQELKYELAMQSQQNLAKEIKKIEQSTKRTSIAHTPTKNEKSAVDASRQTKGQSVSDGDWQEQHHLMKQLEGRVQSLEQFSVGIDKRLFNSMQTLKDSWKDLGTELLENKKTTTRKIDELKIELITLKNLKELSISPDRIEDHFKRTIAQKFSDIYQLLALSVTRKELEPISTRLSEQIKRHEEQFMEIRNQLAENKVFFTFYADNSDHDDLKKQILTLRQDSAGHQQMVGQKFNSIQSNSGNQARLIQALKRELFETLSSLKEKLKNLDDLKQDLDLCRDRIQELQDFNRIGPSKLEKIHSVLDNDLSVQQKQLIESRDKKNSIHSIESTQKQLRIELGKMKDELFLANSQLQLKDQEISLVKKQFKDLQTKMDKFRGESEEAMVSRKPWVCLSCDKQDKDKEKARKQARVKKPEPFKGFGQQRSEKSIKVAPSTPPFEQRFEMYERLKDKYLSDSIKLPEILKQKLRQSSTQFNP